MIECADDVGASIVRMIVAFREKFGPEFFVILVAPDDVLEDVPLASYDEACAAINLNTLISRLAE